MTKKIETEKEKFDKSKEIEKSQVNIIKNNIYNRCSKLNKLTAKERSQLVCFAENELIDKYASKACLSIHEIALAIMKDKQVKIAFKAKADNLILIRNRVIRHNHADSSQDIINRRHDNMIIRSKATKK